MFHLSSLFSSRLVSRFSIVLVDLFGSFDRYSAYRARNKVPEACGCVWRVSPYQSTQQVSLYLQKLPKLKQRALLSTVVRRI